MGLEPTTATLQIRCAITVPCRPLTQQRLTVSTTLNVVLCCCQKPLLLQYITIPFERQTIQSFKLQIHELVE